jgi:hypothetical protein
MMMSVTNSPMIVTCATNNSTTDVFCSGACDIIPQNGQLTFTAAKYSNYKNRLSSGGGLKK